MKKKIKFLVLVLIFLGAINVNAKTVSKNGYTYSIEGYKANIYEIDYMSLTTNPNYLSENSPKTVIDINLDTYTNPVINEATTAGSIPTHFINLNTNEGQLTTFLRTQVANQFQNAGSSNYLAQIVVEYKVTSFPQTLQSAYKQRYMYPNEGKIKLTNISTTTQEQVVSLITLGENSVMPGSTLTINEGFSGYAGNWQTMYNTQNVENGTTPNFIYMFHNFQIDEELMNQQLDEIYSGNNNGSGSNTGNSNGSGNVNSNNGSGLNNDTGTNQGTGNTGINANASATGTDGDKQVVKVDNTAMDMPMSLYIGSTLLLLIGALVISKTMEMEDKQN